MKGNQRFWDLHWREHFIVLVLMSCIGLVMIFCHRCHIDRSACPCAERTRIDLPIDPEPPLPTPVRRPVEDAVQDELPTGIPVEEINQRVLESGGDEGTLNISLAWASIDDLDLRVLQPNGNEINQSQEKRSDPSTGGKLDVDQNFQTGIVSNPVENISWQNPLTGKYLIRIHLYKSRTGQPQIPFTVKCSDSNGGEKLFRTFLENEESVVKVFEFNYPQR